MREGTDHTRLGAYSDAASAFGRAAGLRPNDVTTSLNHAAALLRAGDVEQTLAISDRLLADYPSQPKIHHARGLALHAAGDRAAAIDAFHAAVAIDVGAWRSWQSIADITADEEERRHAIHCAAVALTRLCAEERGPAALLPTCVSALIDAGRAPDAIALTDTSADRFADVAAVHEAQARAWYRQGRFEEAFRSKLRVLEKTDPATPIAKPPLPFAPDEAVVALRDVVDILEGAGLKPFLAAGTLLGFHRNGGPLAHDRDVDIGVMRTAGTPDVVEVVREHQALLLGRDARPGDRYLALIHRGIGIDIFVHDEIDGHLLCGFSSHPGDIQWRFDRFELQNATYGDGQWRVPESPDRYLTETYGADWQTPDTGFASAVSSPALFQVSLYARAYYAVGRAVKAIKNGDLAKARALITQSPIPVSQQSRALRLDHNQEGRP